MALRTTLAAWLTAAALLSLQACATPPPPVYGPMGDSQPYGYRDRSSGDGGLTLLAAVPAHSSLAEAMAFWERRARELCPGGIAKRIVFRAERREIMMPAGYVYRGVGMSSRATMGYEVEGYLYCNAP